MKEELFSQKENSLHHPENGLKDKRVSGF